MTGSILLLHIMDGELPKVPALLLGSVLLIGAGVCFKVSLRAEAGQGSGQPAPVLPAAGREAARRLRDLKRSGASRCPGLRDLSGLAPWKT
jgi:hypothetical protein